MNTRSLSARRAWIEIYALGILGRRVRVALRKESVDRNQYLSGVLDFGPSVALRKESVDRNSESTLKRGGYAVALRKESVDRNTACRICRQHVIGSLSARRAWIEILRISLSGQDSRGRSPQGERG